MGSQLAQQIIGGLALALGEAVAVVQRDPDLHGAELAVALLLIAVPPDRDLVAVGVKVVQQERRLEDVAQYHHGRLVVAAHLQLHGRGTAVEQPGRRHWRGVYEERYRDIRHGVFAHKGLNRTDTDGLIAKTNIEEMKSLFGFLYELHLAPRGQMSV